MPIVFKSSISEVRIAVARVLPEVIDQTADDAINNIDQETKRHHSGRVYPSRREPGVGHTASAPGESFATDTESLVGGMKKEKLSVLTTEIQFHDVMGINRWAVLEFGGGRISARPTIVPTITNMSDRYQHDVASAMLQAITEQELK